MLTVNRINKLKKVISLCVILIIAFFSFFPCLKNGFVNWDDDRYVTENKVIQELSWKNIKKIFTSLFVSNYQPLTMLSYLFEYRFFESNAFAYHLINVILHLLNCLFVFCFIYLLTNRVAPSLVTSVLFSIHPLHVESVAWVSERKDVLYAFFFLAAIICYICYFRQRKINKYYYFSLVLFVFSLLSKSMAITLPAVLLLIDYFLLRERDKSMFIDKIPFFALSLIFGVIALFGQYADGAIRQEGLSNLLQKALISNYSITFYLNKLLIPIRLSCLYPYSETKNVLIYLYPLVNIILLSIAIIISGKYTRKFIFGSAFFLVAVCPVLQFIPIGETIVADRYVYIASLGIFYLIGEGFVWLYTRKTKRAKVFQVLLLIILIWVIVILSLLTWKRCQVWKDSIILWSDVLDNYPNAATAYNNRGAEFLVKKEYNKASSDFINALRIDPSYYEAYFGLGSLYYSLGEYEKAVRMAKRVLKINPAYHQTYYLLLDLYSRMNKHSEVIAICKKLIEIDTNSIEIYINLCSAYGSLGYFEESIVYGKKAIKIDPNSAIAHANLSAAYYHTKQYELAIKHCDKAIELGFKVPSDFLEELKLYRK